MVKGIERYMETMDPKTRSMVAKCDTVEEVFGVVRSEGLELPEEALDTVYGGCSSYTYEIDSYDRCKTDNTRVQLKSVGHDGWPDVYYCPTCLTTKDSSEVQPWTDRIKKKK